ncbi:MAG TPA: HD-GYP domain-containing protein [Miltoncostaeaceae bacterium]|nr:HD-GYP domain-containing protein [Miltoncostaeaceae bacterium]
MAETHASALVRPGDEERLADTLTRDHRTLSGAERRAELLVGGAWVAAVTTLLALAGPGDVRWVDALVVLVVVTLASRVRFAVLSGYTNPVLLGVVPALLLLPPQTVPVLTALALAAAGLPEVLRGRAAPARLLLAPANAWFTVGPAVVLAAAGAPSGSEAAAAVLALALAAQLGVDMLSSWARERLSGGAPLREQLHEAFWVYAVDVAFAPVGLLVALAAEDRTWALALMVPLFGLLQVFAAERRNRMEQLVELSTAYRGTAMVLGDVVESDDAYTGEHCRGVVELALAVCEELRLDRATRQRVEFGALLHDVGKVAVPKEIINKSGPLDADEWEVIKTHTVEGQRMLDTVGGLMRQVGIIVRAHHERWDGTGYPDGLAGEDIPIESRIVSACDTWNAMTTTRSYRRALTRADAVAELRRVAGSQLDPRVVGALLDVIARLGPVPDASALPPVPVAVAPERPPGVPAPAADLAAPQA